MSIGLGLLESGSQCSVASVMAEDVFALGCIAAELFSGECLFSHSTINHRATSSSSISKLPSGVRVLVERCVLLPAEARPTITDVLASDVFGPSLKSVHSFVAQIVAAPDTAAQARHHPQTNLVTTVLQ